MGLLKIVYLPHMVNASKRIVTQSLVLNKIPFMFAQLPTSEGTLPNANEGIHHRSFTFAVPSTYTHCRRTNTFVWHSFGICVHGFTRWRTRKETRPLGYCATCKGSSYTKNEYGLFYHKLDAKYFFIQQFFRKSCVFQENYEKLFWRHI